MSAVTTSVEDCVSLEVPFELDEKRLYKLKSELSQRTVALACLFGGAVASIFVMVLAFSIFHLPDNFLTTVFAFALLIAGVFFGYKVALKIDKKCEDIREDYIQEVSPQIRKVLNDMGWAAENVDVSLLLRNRQSSFPHENGALYRAGFFRTSPEGLTMRMELVNKKQGGSRADKAFRLWKQENPEILVSEQVEAAFKAGYVWND